MDALIDVDLDNVLLPEGEFIVEIFEANTYYGDFIRFLRDPKAGGTRFREHLLSTEVVPATRFRGQTIALARSLGIDFDEATRLVPLAKVSVTDEEAAHLVAENYLSMLVKSKPLRAFAKIDQYGRLVVVEGTHRTAVNYVLGHKRAQFGILSRDKAWVDFVEFFRTEGARLYNDPNKIYHPIDHPDFASFTPVREDRSEPIVKYLSDRGAQRGLDVGSMIGFYSHTLARRGFNVTALEYEPTYASAFRRLAVLYRLDAEVIEGNLYEHQMPPEGCDFAVMLSILYHLLRNDEARCKTWLKSMKSAIPTFVVDTEARTGILTEQRLRGLFEGYTFTLLHRGSDDREIFGISRDG